MTVIVALPPDAEIETPSVADATAPVTATAEPRLERGRYLIQSSVAYLRALRPK